MSNNNPMILELKNISKKINNNTIINNFNLYVEEGEVVSLVGESGSGKTTILQIAGLLLPTSSGQVLIERKNYTNSSNHTKAIIRRNKIGFIYQFHHLLEDLSILENTILPLIINNKTISMSKLKAQGEEILNKVGIEKKLYKENISILSGGQKQKVAVARAIINKPQIIIADEPTGNLDQENSENIMNIIKSIAKKENKKTSIIFATHNSSLLKYSDKIINIKNI